MGDRRLTVQQVADAVGVSVWTIKRLEARGKLPKAKRDHNGYRYFWPDDVRIIRSIIFPPEGMVG